MGVYSYHSVMLHLTWDIFSNSTRNLMTTSQQDRIAAAFIKRILELEQKIKERDFKAKKGSKIPGGENHGKNNKHRRTAQR